MVVYFLSCLSFFLCVINVIIYFFFFIWLVCLEWCVYVFLLCVILKLIIYFRLLILMLWVIKLVFRSNEILWFLNFFKIILWNLILILFVKEIVEVLLNCKCFLYVFKFDKLLKKIRFLKLGIFENLWSRLVCFFLLIVI